jgi:hypothetical protein
MGLFVGLAIAAVIAVAVWVGVRGQRGDQAFAAEIDRGVMADYCRLVGAGQFAGAWDSCLSRRYQADVTREKFVAAHEKRRAEAGALGGCRLLRADLQRNLFSRTRELWLLYELTYPGRVEREYAKIDDADGTWRIEGTYHLNAGDTYDFTLW